MHLGRTLPIDIEAANLLAFERMDGVVLGCIQLAIESMHFFCDSRSLGEEENLAQASEPDY
jgi:hypothetical protein